MIQDPEDEAFNEIERQAKMRQEAVRSLNRKRQIENADRVHQGYEAMTQEKALQALHSENERLGLYKDAYAQPEQEPPKYSFKAYWEIDGRIGVVACIERPDGGVHLMSEILDLPSSTEPQYTPEHQARIAAFKDAMSTTKEKNT